MTTFNIFFTKRAIGDLQKYDEKQIAKINFFLKIMSINPYEPPYEKLIGDFKGCFSRRITIQHRLVYEVYKEERSIKVLRAWSHYE